MPVSKRADCDQVCDVGTGIVVVEAANMSENELDSWNGYWYVCVPA
jgi:hypothetical protein